jgi:replication-associated recombination protein RarA
MNRRPRIPSQPRAPRIQDLLDRRTAEGCLGRDQQLRELASFVAGEMPLVVSIHGTPGIGKTTLARAAAARATRLGVRAATIEAVVRHGYRYRAPYD